MSNSVKKNPPQQQQEEDAESEAPDFSALSKTAPAPGSHFLLKDEKAKYQVNSDVKSSIKLFQIDTKLLNCALKSIPLHERHPTMTVNWKQGEIEQMKREAAVYEKQYKELLQPSPPVEPVAAEAAEEESEPTEPYESAESIVQKAFANTEKETMQEWLDDILND